MNDYEIVSIDVEYCRCGRVAECKVRTSSRDWWRYVYCAACAVKMVTLGLTHADMGADDDD